MTDRAALLMDLAERCEKASGPGEILNADILIAIHPELTHPTWERITYPDGRRAFFADRSDPDGGNVVSPPLFTASLDAALSLVPEGLFWQGANGKRRPDLPQAGAELFLACGPNRGDMLVSVDAATPALALCAAALRALASGAPR